MTISNFCVGVVMFLCIMHYGCDIHVRMACCIYM